ncbi:hypothetical protein BCR39DRAFT_549688 [Naematelia encephala]|uniref:Alpha/Beta hydrolase protein n=1 Tax=Naematelia encephala TaxID=71784 RepID=A0A1Y2ALA7_9TREE|nr:hypothetical protein BCR39DRAFT_549688 [Naematelia encephala]
MSIPPSPAGPMSGILSHYTTGDHSYPYLSSGKLSSKKVVIFIGGLFNGLGDVGYVVPLSEALEAIGWKLAIMYWSGAYEGFGTGSLDRDVKEIGDLVKLLRETGHETIICMGHSTGCQDVIHYLTTTSPSKHLPTSPLGDEHALPLPTIQGGIMQAPVSDRECMRDIDVEITRAWREVLPEATELVNSGKAEQLLSEKARKVLGMVAWGYRIWSFGDISGDDDYFSSDLPSKQDNIHTHTHTHTHPLDTSFGKLTVPVLAIWSGKDEYSKAKDYNRPLLERWQDASHGKLEFDIIKNASHAVVDDKDRKILCGLVVDWLNKYFENTTNTNTTDNNNNNNKDNDKNNKTTNKTATRRWWFW